MKRIYIFVIICTFFSCQPAPPDHLTAFLKQELSKENGVIDFSGLEEVKWDRLYIIHAYTDERNYDETLLTYKSVLDEKRGLDGYCTLALFDGEKLVSLSFVPANFAAFSEASKFVDKNRLGFYFKKEAIFKYVISFGTPWVVRKK